MSYILEQQPHEVKKKDLVGASTVGTTLNY